jgi:hypothetical protein
MRTMEPLRDLLKLPTPATKAAQNQFREGERAKNK